MTMDLGNVQLRKPPELEPPHARRSTTRLWVAVTLLVVAAAAAAYILFGRGDRELTTPPGAAGARNSAEPRIPLGGAPADIAVPPLDESDALVRQLVAALSSHPRVAAWLATDDLIRNFTAVVQDISAGMTPASRLQALAPGGSFRVVDREGDLHIDTQSYARYDSLADAIASIDAAGAASLYATLKPRIEEADDEQGFPHVPFDRTLERAIVRLLQTPVVSDTVAVEAQGAKVFAYADPQLERLSAAQKHLLRMGPRNVRIIREKLREIAIALGIPETALR